MRHREDIDGLRALAVVPVMLYHAGVSALPGGFLGVDIFFVISGFLITSIVVRELEAGTFTFLDFYRRRAIRILPALFAMVAITFAIGAVVLLPLEMLALGRSMVATAMFAANVYFWHKLDYFGGAAEAQPLLHTWSLGVEEQFYLLYPFLLLLVHRFAPSRLKLILSVAVAVSLTLSIGLSGEQARFAFYMLPTRAWELGLGAIVAVGALPRLSARAARLVASAGLVAVLTALIMTGPDNPSPFPAAILPAVGATSLIAYGQAGPTARLLSLAPLRAVGLMSYSLYLWHWPILSLYRITHGFKPGPVEILVLLAAAAVAATLSYHFIERPLQRRRARWRPHFVIATAAGAAAVAAAAGGVLILAGPAISRAPPEALRLEAFANYPDSRDFDHESQVPCPILGSGDPARDSCLRPDPRRRDVLIVGDSYARHIWRAIEGRFPDLHVMPSFAGYCRPLIGAGGDKRCRAQFDYLLRNLVAPARVDAVVLSAHWHADEIGFLAPTIRAIKARGVAVTVIGPVVEYNGIVPALLARSAIMHDPNWFASTRLREFEDLDRQMEAITLASGAQYYSIYRAECPPNRTCQVLTRGGEPLHWDQGHLMRASAEELTAGLPRP